MSKFFRPLPLAISALLLPGCFLIPNEVQTARGDAVTQEAQTEKIAEKKSFSHELWDGLLKEHNAGGFLDYRALQKDPSALDNYLALAAKFSPKSHKELFDTEADELAYWINVYNALCVKNVLRRFDGEFKSVFLDQKTFFYSDRFELGGEFRSLYFIEKKIVLPDFSDPRVHFALNCASFSCPRLPEEAFSGPSLEDQLGAETRRFLSEERNVRIDEAAGKLRLSKLFDWYRSDFCELSGLPEVEAAEGEAAKVIAYINHYRDEGAKIPEREGGWTLEYRRYNWMLNEQGNEKGEPGVYGD